MTRYNGGEYVGLWHGGSGYSFGEWATDAEVFDSLQHARAVLYGRRARGYVMRQTVPHVAEWRESPNGGQSWAVKGEPGHNLIAPCVAEDSFLLLAPRDRVDLESLERDGEMACSHRIEFGPRGGLRTVHL